MKKSFVKYIVAMLLFGSNGIVASNINLTSYNIVLLRTMIGSMLLISLFLLSKKKFTLRSHLRDFGFIALSGVAMGTSWMFLYEAYSQIGVSISSLLYYCGPVIVMVLSPVIFKERLTIPKIFGFLMVLVGIFLVNGQQNGKLNVWGITCGVLSAVMYSVMVISNKKSKNITGMENSLIQLFISFLTVAVFVGIKSGYSIRITPDDWIWVAVLGILNTGIGCYFYFSSIGNLPVQSVAICGYLELLSAVIFSVIFLREQLLFWQIVGAVLVIGGALVGECFGKKHDDNCTNRINHLTNDSKRCRIKR